MSSEKSAETEILKEKTGEIYQVPASAANSFKPGNTVPLRVITDQDFAAIEENQPQKNPEKIFVLGTKFLVLSNGVNVRDHGEYIYISNSSFFVWAFLFFASISMLLIGMLFWQNSRLPKQVVVEKIVEKPQKGFSMEVKAADLKEEKSLNNLQPAENKESEELKVYFSAEEVIPLVKDSAEESQRILEEAIKIRQEAAATSNESLMTQAIYRLRAVLMKSKISTNGRRQAAYNLWVIYDCNLKWKGAAAKMKKLLLQYNREAKDEKYFRPICPLK